VNTDPGFFWWLGADHPDQQATTSLAVADADFSAWQKKMTLAGSIPNAATAQYLHFRVG
jgi:hypothetical protein